VEIDSPAQKEGLFLGEILPGGKGISRREHLGKGVARGGKKRGRVGTTLQLPLTWIIGTGEGGG